MLHEEIEPMAIVLWLKHPDDISFPESQFLRGLRKKKKQGKKKTPKHTHKENRERKKKSITKKKRRKRVCGLFGAISPDLALSATPAGPSRGLHGIKFSKALRRSRSMSHCLK